jgi:hypothetical protein
MRSCQAGSGADCSATSAEALLQDLSARGQLAEVCRSAGLPDAAKVFLPAVPGSLVGAGRHTAFAAQDRGARSGRMG